VNLKSVKISLPFADVVDPGQRFTPRMALFGRQPGDTISTVWWSIHRLPALAPIWFVGM
jgi:hypothetical protein